MESTELLRPSLAASESAADAPRHNPDRDRIEAFLALQAKNESEQRLKATLLSLYDKGLIKCKWDDNGELLMRAALRMNNRVAEYAKA
jgi:hypothetical protein